MTNEPDKLAEAIASCVRYPMTNDLGFPTPIDRDTVFNAARAYHDMPVVDVKHVKLSTIFGDENVTNGWNECLAHLLTAYPQGLKWK